MSNVINIPRPIKEQASSFIDNGHNAMQKMGERIVVNRPHLFNRGKLKFSYLQKALLRAIDNEESSASIGFNLQDDRAAQFKTLADYLHARGVRQPDTLDAILRISLAEGFEPKRPAERVNASIRTRTGTLAQIDQLCEQHNIKRSQLLDQVLEFFFDQFEGLPEQEIGHVLTHQTPD